MKYRLQDLIDLDLFQNLQDRLNEIYSFPSAIIDNEGNILTATAWQDICLNFHRRHPDTRVQCVASDKYIMSHLHEANPAVSYRCPHGLVDNATPIIIDGEHYGNFFTGQFFLEEPDLDFFRKQAREHGFDEDEYLRAVRRVPVWSQAQLDSYLFFIKGLIAIISESGLRNLKEIENRREIEASERRYRSMLRTSMAGFWLVDADGHLLEVNDAYCRMTGYSEDELLSMRIWDLDAQDSRADVAERTRLIFERGSARFESRHRKKDGTLFDVELSILNTSRADSRFTVFINDITERKRSENALRVLAESGNTGNSITRTLVRELAESLGVRCAYLMTIHSDDPGKGEIVALWDSGRFGTLTEIAIGGCPCSEILSDGPQRYSRDVRSQFPHAPMLDELNAESYWGVPLRDRNGQVFGVFAIVHDREMEETPQTISLLNSFAIRAGAELERDRAVAEMRRNQYYLEKAQELGHVGTWELNLESGELLWTDESYRIFDISPGTPLGFETFINLVHPEDREMVQREWVSALAGEPYELEHRVRVEGGVRWIREMAEIERDEVGTPIRAIGITQDVTERRQAIDELRSRSQLIETLVRFAPVGLSINDMDNGDVLYVNETFSRAYRIPLELCTSVTAFLDYVYADRPELAKQIAEDVASGDPDRMHWEKVPVIDRTTGETGFVSARNFIVEEQGLMISTVEDITERVRAEEERALLEAQLMQSQKLEAVGRLAGGVAHDFNNMLSIIVGNAEMALASVEPSNPQHAPLAEILGAAQRSVELTRQLLAFARKQTVAPQVLDLNEVVGGMIRMLTRLIGENIDLSWNPGDDLWRVRIDPTQLDQVLANLIVNARDAMDEGGEVSIATSNTVVRSDEGVVGAAISDGDYVAITVSDNGAGMDDVTRSRLFEPFFTTKERSKGTGLGLATVYGIIRQNDGFIEVDSEPGRGTAFRIYLPRHVGEGGTQLHSSQHPQAEGGSETILLVEDEPSILKIATMLLERQGYAVLAASSPSEAVRIAESFDGSIDLLMTDVIMPEMNGRDLAAQILERHPQLRRLFMSGYTADVIAPHGVLEEDVHFIQKPFNVKDLASRVREVLDAPPSRSR